jgi:hypothetical protein
MIFKIIPYMLIRVQLRSIRRKKKYSQFPLSAFFIFANLLGALNGAIVQNQKYRFFRVCDKALQKFYKYPRVHTFLCCHEFHCSTCADRRDQVDFMSRNPLFLLQAFFRVWLKLFRSGSQIGLSIHHRRRFHHQLHWQVV